MPGNRQFWIYHPGDRWAIHKFTEKCWWCIMRIPVNNFFEIHHQTWSGIPLAAYKDFEIPHDEHQKNSSWCNSNESPPQPQLYPPILRLLPPLPNIKKNLFHFCEILLRIKGMEMNVRPKVWRRAFCILSAFCKALCVLSAFCMALGASRLVQRSNYDLCN